MKKHLFAFLAFAALLPLLLFPVHTFAASEDSGIRKLLVSEDCILVLREDGRVFDVPTDGSDIGVISQLPWVRELQTWENVTDIAQCNTCFAGLKTDGTVEVAAYIAEEIPDLYKELKSWTDVDSLESGYSFLGGIRKDGTVLFAGSDPGLQEGLLSRIRHWQNVVKLEICVCGEAEYVYALTRDGRILGSANSGWTGDPSGIVDIQSNGWMMAGLKSDGTVVARGTDAQSFADVLRRWNDLKQVVTGDTVAIGLKQDGSLICTPGRWEEQLKDLSGVERIELNMYRYFAAYFEDGRVLILEAPVGEDALAETKTWTDIRQVYVGDGFVLGLKKDGSVVSAGLDFNQLWPEVLSEQE